MTVSRLRLGNKKWLPLGTSRSRRWRSCLRFWDGVESPAGPIDGPITMIDRGGGAGRTTTADGGDGKVAAGVAHRAVGYRRRADRHRFYDLSEKMASRLLEKARARACGAAS